jgi:hyperosmotically inducible protein
MHRNPVDVDGPGNRTTAAGRQIFTNEETTMTRNFLFAVTLTVLSLHGADSMPTNRLERQIRHELVMLPYCGVFDRLVFSVNGGTVTLLGEVTRPTLKSSAENVVKDLEGITKVDNKIKVLPLSPNDDRLRIDLYRAIYGHSALNRYAMQAVPSIHIIVDNGNVVLDGVVTNDGDRNIANIQANSVSGVFSVQNNLQIEGTHSNRPAK